MQASVENGEPLILLRAFFRGRSCCRFLFHEPFEVREIVAERSGYQYRLDDRTNLGCHFCRVTAEWIKKYDADAEMVRDTLPRDPPVGNAHHDRDNSFHFLAIDHRRTREACVIDLFHLLD